MNTTNINDINQNNNNNNVGSKEPKIPKILLMGKAGVGKTSMRAIIFANCAPRDTFVLGWTHDVLESRLRFMGNKMLNLLDCGGQNEFIRQYLESKREQIFSNVEILVFVITAEKPKTDDKDLTYFEECVNALEEYSKDAKIFVLIHKMDLIADHRKQSVFEKRQKEVKDKSKGFNVTCFQTSIWEDSLYKAWTEIVSTLVSDMNSLKLNLQNLALACNAEEVILFEKSTFLLTCHYSKKTTNDDQRFEKISHIIKTFKLSCINTKSSFQSMVIKTKNFMTYLEEFTRSTYIMIIINDKSVNNELLKLNIDLTRNTKVKDILPGKCGYNLIVKVVTKNVLIDIVRLDTTRVVIADFVIGDETGVVKMRLRNENFVDIIKQGQTIIIRNCKVPIVNQHMRMQVDAFGKIENCYDHIIHEVNMEKDLSAVVYDNYSVRKRFNNNNNQNNQRYGGFRDDRTQNYSYNDVASVGTFLSSQIAK